MSPLVLLLILFVIFLSIGLVYQCYRGWALRSQLKEVTKQLKATHHGKETKQVFQVTTDKQLRELLKEMNGLIQDKNRTVIEHHRIQQSMSKMLTNISHDLKTPLSVIMGYSELLLLQKEMDKGEREKLHKRIHEKSEALLATINDFFTLSKLEAGDYETTRERINLAEICRQKILEYYEQLEEHEMKVQLDFEQEQLICFLDQQKIDRVLDNLISNAIRYGSDGKQLGIKLYLETESIKLTIWDRGKGIPKGEKEKIFYRLYTLEDSRNKRYQGSGLGLTITKRLVGSMGGSINISSIPYEKTSFMITLPYETDIKSRLS